MSCSHQLQRERFTEDAETTVCRMVTGECGVCPVNAPNRSLPHKGTVISVSFGESVLLSELEKRTEMLGPILLRNGILWGLSRNELEVINILIHDKTGFELILEIIFTESI